MKTERKSATAAAKYAAKRDLILDAALELFRENGYDATSLQQVADKTGFLKGSLYYYLQSKEDILAELAERVHASFGRTLEQYQRAEGPVLLRIETLLRSVAVDAGKNQDLLVVFYREFPRISEERRAKIIKLRDEQEKLLVDLIAEGQRAAEIRPEVDPKIAAIGLEAMANSVYTWYKPSGRKTLNSIAKELAALAVQGLRASPVQSAEPSA